MKPNKFLPFGILFRIRIQIQLIIEEDFISMGLVHIGRDNARTKKAQVDN